MKWRLRKQDLNPQGCKELYLVYYGHDRYNATYVGYVKNKDGMIVGMFKDTKQIYSKKYDGMITKEIKKQVLIAFHVNYFAIKTDYVSESLNSSDGWKPFKEEI